MKRMSDEGHNHDYSALHDLTWTYGSKVDGGSYGARAKRCGFLELFNSKQ